MATRELASFYEAFYRKLGALEVFNVEDRSVVERQPFEYLLVLDFEATCWDITDSKKSCPEIIEFPVVLYDVRKNVILDEFQQYVMPTEHPKLSAFCTELTGIEQNQVDKGVSLQTCLVLFNRWLNAKKILHDMEFPYINDKLPNSCAFATWSDWDLGTCLKNECNRKKLSYSKAFRKWIDVKKLFAHYYKKPFNGLHGALSEMGLQFEGREHCGLDDARNTAKLIGKMIENGVVFQLTRC